MSPLGSDRSFGLVGSMSGLPESGHDWAIYEYAPLKKRNAGHSGDFVGVRPAERSLIPRPRGRGRPWLRPIPGLSRGF